MSPDHMTKIFADCPAKIHIENVVKEMDETKYNVEELKEDMNRLELRIERKINEQTNDIKNTVLKVQTKIIVALGTLVGGFIIYILVNWAGFPKP